MARMGHDNERTALIYQHESSAADRQIAKGLDALLRASRTDTDDCETPDGLMARQWPNRHETLRTGQA
jgi:hypothetical protein